MRNWKNDVVVFVDGVKIFAKLERFL
jgi:hypothetical protein